MKINTIKSILVWILSISTFINTNNVSANTTFWSADLLYSTPQWFNSSVHAETIYWDNIYYVRWYSPNSTDYNIYTRSLTGSTTETKLTWFTGSTISNLSTSWYNNYASDFIWLDPITNKITAYFISYDNTVSRYRLYKTNLEDWDLTDKTQISTENTDSNYPIFVRWNNLFFIWTDLKLRSLNLSNWISTVITSVKSDYWYKVSTDWTTVFFQSTNVWLYSWSIWTYYPLLKTIIANGTWYIQVSAAWELIRSYYLVWNWVRYTRYEGSWTIQEVYNISDVWVKTLIWTWYLTILYADNNWTFVYGSYYNGSSLPHIIFIPLGWTTPYMVWYNINFQYNIRFYSWSLIAFDNNAKNFYKINVLNFSKIEKSIYNKYVSWLDFVDWELMYQINYNNSNNTSDGNLYKNNISLWINVSTEISYLIDWNDIYYTKWAYIYKSTLSGWAWTIFYNGSTVYPTTLYKIMDWYIYFYSNQTLYKKLLTDTNPIDYLSLTTWVIAPPLADKQKYFNWDYKIELSWYSHPDCISGVNIACYAIKKGSLVLGYTSMNYWNTSPAYQRVRFFDINRDKIVFTKDISNWWREFYIMSNNTINQPKLLLSLPEPKTLQNINQVSLTDSNLYYTVVINWMYQIYRKSLEDSDTNNLWTLLHTIPYKEATAWVYNSSMISYDWLKISTDKKYLLVYSSTYWYIEKILISEYEKKPPVTVKWNYIYKKQLDNFMNSTGEIKDDRSFLWNLMYWNTSDNINDSVVKTIYDKFITGVNETWIYMIRKWKNIFTVTRE